MEIRKQVLRNATLSIGSLVKFQYSKTRQKIVELEIFDHKIPKTKNKNEK